MPLFQKKKKRRIIQHRADQTLEAALEKALIRQARKDPEWALKKALKKFDMEDEPEKPGEKEAQLIAAEITKMALTEIKRDPELSARFVQRRVSEIVGELPAENDDGNDFDLGDPIDRLIHQKEQLEALGIVGGGGGALGGLINADVIKAALNLVATRFGGNDDGHQIPQNTQPPERMVVIDMGGKLTQVTETQYNQLLTEGKLRPVAVLGPAKTADEAAPESPSQQAETLPIEYQELPSVFDAVDFGELGGYLEMEPQDFINLLIEQSDAGVVYAPMLIDYLKKSSVSAVDETISPYRDNPRVATYVEKLLSPDGQTWLHNVLDLVKDVELGQQGAY